MKRTRQEKLRLGLLFVIVCCFFAAVFGRLVHLQIFLSPVYGQIVQKQSSGTVPIPASRGIVYDRNGKVVANNVYKCSLYAYPRDGLELKQVAAYVEKRFELAPGSAVKKFGLGVKRFRWIKRMLDDCLAEKIASEAPPGLLLRQETQREYPYDLIGRQLLGFTNIDNQGMAGVEMSYDSVLAGRPGLADIRRDGLRNTYRVEERALVKPEPGRSLVLTLDWNLQEIVEEELQNGLRQHKAKSGMAVFLNCNTGEVLAMAHYDPDEKDPGRPVKLRAVSDQFEPGSVFKAFTAAGVIEENLIDYSDSIFCEEGKWKVDRRLLHDDKEHGWLNFRQVMELSSNIGIAKCALVQGGEGLMETLERFGFGKKTCIGLPGEAEGMLAKQSRWSDYNVAALAMGHSVAVTALQIANGFAAIANGGSLHKPQIIMGHVDLEGNLVNRCRPEPLGTVLSETAADTLKAILRGVVERGTAEVVNSSVVSIAGKTGTAQIPDLVNKGYFRNKFTASFAGFFPYEKPLIAGIVVYEDPQPVHYGGWTAGPVFKAIAERYSILHPDRFTAPQRMLTESSDKFQNTSEVPSLVGRDVSQAGAIAAQCGLELRTNDSSGIVIWQFPTADRIVFEGHQVLAIVAEESSGSVRLPDLCGLSIRQASAFLKRFSIKFRVQGNGRVVKQSIRPGQHVDDQTVCTLECLPHKGGKYKAQRADKAGERVSGKRES